MTIKAGSYPSTAETDMTQDRWNTGRILVLGMTYPHYSETYTENACTGGILEETGALVRLYPLPHRYLAHETRPKTFQWIRVRYQKHESDRRPESLHIEPNSITLEELLESDATEERRAWITRCTGLMRSVEEVRRAQRHDGTSLAIIQPAEIIAVNFERRSDDERAEWKKKERAILAQERMTSIVGGVKPIDFPETRFMVKWRCEDPECSTHQMGVEDWGLHELWRKLARDPERESKVAASFERMLDLRKRDVYFYLGNFRHKPWNFGLMGVCSLKRKPIIPQLGLGF